MSTTLPRSVTKRRRDDALPAPPSPGSSSTGRLIGAAALAVGGLLAAAGMALHLGAMPEDERLTQAIADDPQWAASHVLLGLGFAVVAIGAAQLVWLVHGRGARFAAAGAAAFSLGAILMALSDIAHGALGLALRDQVDAGKSLDIHLAYFEHPAILGLNLGPTLLTIGMILLGIGMIRSRLIPNWAGLVVLLTPIAVSGSFALGLPPYLQAVPFLVGVLVLASTSRSVAGAPAG